MRRDLWTDERKAEARALFDAGLSARQTADRMGFATRGPVVGIWTRMGLARGGKAKSHPGTRKSGSPAVLPRLAPRPARPQSALANPPVVARAGGAKRKPVHGLLGRPAHDPCDGDGRPVAKRKRGKTTILTRQHDQCAYVIGEPVAEALVCGHPVAREGASYCEEHAAICYSGRLQWAHLLR